VDRRGHSTENDLMMTTTARRTPFLSWLLLTALLVLAYALLSKWMKWPAGTVLLITAAVLSWAGTVVRMGKGPERAALFVWRATIAAMTTYIVFRLLYWPGSAIVAAAVIVFMLISARSWWNSDRSRRPALIGMLLLFGSTVALMITPVHALYGYMNFRTPGGQRFIHSGCGHWYRYSWLLYQDGQLAKSKAMLDSAEQVVRDHDRRTGKNGEWILVKLRDARARIDGNTWDQFKELDE
jgi:hypothetical protein